MKQRMLSLVLALVLTSTIGVFPAAAEEESEESIWSASEVILEPVGDTVTREEIEDAIVKKILSEPAVKKMVGIENRIQVGPLCVDSGLRAQLLLWVEIISSDAADTVSLTCPVELAQFSTCIGKQSGDVIACGGKSTRRVPVKTIEGWEDTLVVFASGVPVVVIGGIGESATVSYGTGKLTSLEADGTVVIGNQKMSVIRPTWWLSNTELVTTTLSGHVATPEERGAFAQAYSVTLSFTDGAGNDLGEALTGESLENHLLVALPFDATLVRCPGVDSSSIRPARAGEKGSFGPLTACGTYVFGSWDCPFGDVKKQDGYFPAVFDAVDRGRMSGTSATTFSPDWFITREMLLTTLWRMAGKPGSNTNLLSYADVSSISEYAIGAFQWALEKKIINPAGDRLNPKGQVTREMLAVILTNYATAKGEGPAGEVKGSPEYDDADEISPWAYKGVMFAVKKGWMEGAFAVGKFLKGSFYPQDFYTRAELANVLAMF